MRDVGEKGDIRGRMKCLSRCFSQEIIEHFMYNVAVICNAALISKKYDL